MRAQRGPQGAVIGAAPTFLVVGPARETQAEQLVAQITAAAPANANPFAGRLQVVVEPRFSDANAWYLVADPAMHDGLEFAYFSKASAPSGRDAGGLRGGRDRGARPARLRRGLGGLAVLGPEPRRGVLIAATFHRRRRPVPAGRVRVSAACLGSFPAVMGFGRRGCGIPLGSVRQPVQAAARCSLPRKLAAVLSYRVAMARVSLRRAQRFSTRWRLQ